MKLVYVLLATAVAEKHRCYKPELAPKHDPKYVKSPLPHTYTAHNDLPKQFDWRSVNGTNYLTSLLNQHIPTYCGSCWLHGATAVLNDRIKIARGGAGPDVMLARQVVLNCGADAGTCKGGSDSGVYDYVMKQGLPDETCQQYDATDHECSDFRTCMNCDAPDFVKAGTPMCYPVQRYAKFFVEEWGPLAPEGQAVTPHAMKAEIYRRGPITCSVDSSNLEQGHYKRGDIVSKMTRPDGNATWQTDHIISVVGWGVELRPEEDVEYWWVRNSWGRYWGEDGFVRVRTGKNIMNIESSCNWAVPTWPPKTEDFGPSDAGHLFPTGDGPSPVYV